jgi:NTP pyrophosphatase (non-canonical NTP hydrolase)
MELSHGNVGQMPLDEYVAVVARIYSKHDNHRSIWDVWLHTLHHAAGVAEQIRRGAADKDLHIEIADFSLWLFTLVLKLTGRFGQSDGRSETPVESLIRIQNNCSDLLWHKYPKTCPSCYARRIAVGRIGEESLYPRACECSTQEPLPKGGKQRRERINALREHSKEISSEKPRSIDEWQEMFGTIFARSVEARSLTDIALHLMEELGEVSDAMIRMYTYRKDTFIHGEPNWRQSSLEAQIADVFSRLFGLVEKLNRVKIKIQSGVVQPYIPVRLSTIIWERYGSDSEGAFHCPFCACVVCSCGIILVPATRPIEDLLEKYI